MTDAVFKERQHQEDLWHIANHLLEGEYDDLITDPRKYARAYGGDLMDLDDYEVEAIEEWAIITEEDVEELMKAIDDAEKRGVRIVEEDEEVSDTISRIMERVIRRALKYA